jgi:exopolyphosphatase/guanosine-5'-triphosphate,3'-diphosphate pyrophosphatase
VILAAIDIGSNAARLLISEASVYKDGTVDFTKLTLLRIPLRLGFDVFDTGTVSEEKKKKLIETLKAYKLLMNIYNVQSYKACATSAMRDATNGPEILKEIKSETGMSISIITGQEEATVLYETHIAEKLSENKSYLYIDVGGRQHRGYLVFTKPYYFQGIV